ncbi:MAG: hypothetical protein MZV63_15085 [Marinilabiliales bacterium]|nr:hypothetical protein [Marinilabiliales bacterium]
MLDVLNNYRACSRRPSGVCSAKASLDGETEARRALNELCRNYWAPIHAFIRGRGVQDPEAQDLTQDFMLHLWQKEFWGRADRGRGRFRSFLLGALVRFLGDVADRGRAEKRGGDVEHVESGPRGVRGYGFRRGGDGCAGDRVRPRVGARDPRAIVGACAGRTIRRRRKPDLRGPQGLHPGRGASTFVRGSGRPVGNLGRRVEVGNPSPASTISRLCSRRSGSNRFSASRD